MQIKISATQPQADFLNLNCKFPAFIAGFGTGKSEVMCNSALLDSLEGGSDSLVAMYEPTYDLVRLILAPRMEQKLIDWGVRYNYNKSENIIYTSSGQMGDFVLRSLDNPTRIVGYESFRAKIDEIDILKMQHANEAWNKIIARNRQKPKTYNKISDKPLNTVSIFSTPEGFKFAYSKWADNPKPDYEMIQAATTSNPFLPDDYVQSLRDTYPAQLIDAYINGEFVNLTSGSVYPCFDRVKHNSSETENGSEPLIVGMDFNVNNMAACIFVQRGKEYHQVDEITKGRDTSSICETLKQKYPNRRITVYPDASGKNSSSKGASISDISIIKQFGFWVVADDANPRVKDRVNSVNKAFESGRLFINTLRCPETTRCIEQQAYDDNGEPDKKSGLDHQCFTGDTLIATSNGVEKISEMSDSGFVYGADGLLRRYNNCSITGKDKVTVSVVFEDGSVIRCTPDHKFLVDGGLWVQAKNLKGKKCLLLASQYRSLTGKDTTNAENTSQGKVTSLEVKGFIGKFGRIITVKYQMAFTFTTKITTKIITKLKTFSSFQNLSTQSTIQTVNGLLSLGEDTSIKQKSGTHRKLVESGIGNTTITTKKNCTQRFKKFAKTVGLNLLDKKGLGSVSALKTANLHTEKNQVLITSRESVSFAESYLQSTNTLKQLGVRDVIKESKTDVYCLTVDDHGCFALANGLIVSNCDSFGYPIIKLLPIIKPMTKGFTVSR